MEEHTARDANDDGADGAPATPLSFTSASPFDAARSAHNHQPEPNSLRPALVSPSLEALLLQAQLERDAADLLHDQLCLICTIGGLCPEKKRTEERKMLAAAANDISALANDVANGEVKLEPALIHRADRRLVSAGLAPVAHLLKLSVKPRRSSGRPRGAQDYTEQNKPLFYWRVVEKAVDIVFDGSGMRVNKTNLAKVMVEGETKIGAAINTLGPDLKHLERRIVEMAVQGVDRDTISATILKELLGN